MPELCIGALGMRTWDAEVVLVAGALRDRGAVDIGREVGTAKVLADVVEAVHRCASRRGGSTRCSDERGLLGLAVRRARTQSRES